MACGFLIAPKGPFQPVQPDCVYWSDSGTRKGWLRREHRNDVAPLTNALLGSPIIFVEAQWPRSHHVSLAGDRLHRHLAAE